MKSPMLDIKKIRDNLDEYKIVIAKKKRNVDVNVLLDLDDQRKNLQKQIDDLKFQQKKL